MAVITCTTRDGYAETLLAQGGSIKSDCPGCNQTGDSPNKVHIATYEGAVLGTWEHNGYNDSDFYALVWDGEGLKSIEYATTRGWSYHNGAAADATDEVKALAAEWIAARDIKAWADATAIDAATPEKGKRAEVVKGRKVALGTTGTIIWIGPDRYKKGAYRVGLKDDEGETHWTAESNIKVLDAEQYLTDLDEIVLTTSRRAERLLGESAGDWVSAYRSRGGALHLRTNYHRVDDAKDLIDTEAIESAIANRAAVVEAAEARQAAEAAAERESILATDLAKAIRETHPEYDDDTIAIIAGSAA